jgi:fatty acid desaturase
MANGGKVKADQATKKASGSSPDMGASTEPPTSPGDDLVSPKMKQLLAAEVPDPVDVAALWPWDKLALMFMRDARDLDFVHFVAFASAVVIPNVYLMFTTPKWLPYGIAIHVLFLGVFTKRFVLLLHCTSHRKVASPGWDFLNLYIPWVLGPFFGQPPDSFYLHHVWMHHVQNNGPRDLSCTLFFQRDSAWDFVQYFSRFFFLGPFQLPIYFASRGMYLHALRLVVGEFGYWAMCAYLSRINLVATLASFIVPLLLVRFGMMSGNWAQHAFISPARPYDDFTSSITTLGTFYNKFCFNDGYHTTHHLNARLHWFDMPQDIMNRAPQFIASGALIFNGLDFHDLFWCLMFKDYKKIAKAIIPLDGKERPEAELIALIKERVRALTPEEARAAALKSGVVVEPYTVDVKTGKRQ